MSNYPIKIKPKKAQNYLLPTDFSSLTRTGGNNKNNANQYISRVQIARVRQDIQTWRQAIVEAELAWLPHRVKMQQIFIDTILNGHVDACMSRRKDLTLMKEFSISNSEGKVDEYWDEIFHKQWFHDILNYILDAQFYGYSLVNWTEINADCPDNIQLVRRSFVSPDRLVIAPFSYSIGGKEFLEGDLSPWTFYIKTPTDNGVSPCGYGLLYKVAYYEIFLRNLMGYNGDFVELYSQPYRVGKTTKTTEGERAEFEKALRDMGSAAYALIDPDDQIEFIETSQAGTGWKGYENLEMRCEKKISKLILGHADALDSTAGKLGAGQGGETSPSQVAMDNVASAQNRFVAHNVNDGLIPKLREAGIGIPEGLRLVFGNDDELMEQRAREDANNSKTAEFASNMKQAGYEIDEAWLSERTGVPIVKAAVPPPATPFKNETLNKLKKLYK